VASTGRRQPALPRVWSPITTTFLDGLSVDLDQMQHSSKGDPALRALLKSAMLQSALQADYVPHGWAADASVRHLVPPQSRIGWHHMLQGRILKSTVQHQENCHCNQSPAIPTAGKQWGRKLLTTTWLTVLRKWKHRFESAHRCNSKERQQRAQSQCRRQVQACCSFLPNVPTQDRTLLDSSLEETLSKNPQQTETWPLMVESLMQQT